MSDENTVLIYHDSCAKDHKNAEGISGERESQIGSVENKNDDSSVDKSVIPTRLTLLLTVTFAGVWGAFHIAGAFTSTSYIQLVHLFGLSTSNPQVYEFITSLFVHGSFAHLFINAVAFLSFGGLLHRHLGSGKKYMTYFILSGMFAAFVQLQAFNYAGFSQDIPIVGASGAICALFGYFALAKPNSQVKLFFVLNMKAKNALAGFFLISIIAVSTWGVGAGGIAHLAHVSGLTIGVVTAVHMNQIPEKAPLIDADYIAPLRQLHSLIPRRLIG